MSIRLADLAPKWIEDAGRRVGFTFLCPHCKSERLFCTLVGLSMREQMRLLALAHPDNHGEIVPAKQGYAWQIVGGSNFADLSIIPSIDASTSGHWHGFISGGEIR